MIICEPHNNNPAYFGHIFVTQNPTLTTHSTLFTPARESSKRLKMTCLFLNISKDTCNVILQYFVRYK